MCKPFLCRWYTGICLYVSRYLDYLCLASDLFSGFSSNASMGEKLVALQKTNQKRYVIIEQILDVRLLQWMGVLPMKPLALKSYSELSSPQLNSCIRPIAKDDRKYSVPYTAPLITWLLLACHTFTRVRSTEKGVFLPYLVWKFPLLIFQPCDKKILSELVGDYIPSSKLSLTNETLKTSIGMSMENVQKRYIPEFHKL